MKSKDIIGALLIPANDPMALKDHWINTSNSNITKFMRNLISTGCKASPPSMLKAAQAEKDTWSIVRDIETLNYIDICV